MIEQELEGKIVAAIAALGVVGLEVRGLWNPVSAGLVKGDEADASVPAAAIVRVGPRSFGSYTIPTVSLDCSVALVVRTDLDPTGEILAGAADAISEKIAAWHADVCESDDAGLAFDGFVPGGFSASGGSGPDFDRSAATWAVTWSFTIAGTLVPIEEPSVPIEEPSA